MKILESAPDWYDRGIRFLLPGILNQAYERLISQVNEGQRVLDIGCGTGALLLKASRKGAKVKGIDVNPRMLEIAQTRIDEADLSRSAELCEMGVAELESEPTERYDIVMSGLCFSELTEDELRYTLKEVTRILKPNGLLLVADETKPVSLPKRMLNRMVRTPLKIITFLLTRTTTNAVEHLPAKVKEAGLEIGTIRLNKIENFIELTARKRNEG